MTTQFLHKSLFRQHWEAIEESAKKAGRSVSRKQWRVAREIYVAETTEQARRDALNGPMARTFTEYFLPVVSMGPIGVSAFKFRDDIPDEAITAEYMLDNYWIVGDPEECARQIRELYELSGGFGTLLVICHDWGEEREKWYRSLELLAKEVIPSLGLEVEE